MDIGWIIILSVAALSGVAILARLGLQTWVKTLVEKSVATKFEKELETVRSDLRLKESKIAALQSSALTGRAGRQAMIDKRRLEAIENLWREVVKLDVLLWPARMMQILKMDALDSLAKTDANVRSFVEAISGGDMNDKFRDMRPEIERPFLPADVWKVFAAYRSLLIFCYARIKAASVGVGENVFKDEEMLKDIKAVMPHFSEYLDKWGISGAAGLAQPLREMVFESLRAALASNVADVEQVTGSSEVMKMISELDRKMVDQISPA